MGSDECLQGGGQPELQEESWIDLGKKKSSPSQPEYLQKYKLYETHSNFYMIGWDKSRTIWKVLKIDRSEPFELNLVEDPAIYSEGECFDLLQRIHDGNMVTGGLKFVTVFYGIVGFVRFCGPYYMLLITKRRKVGRICGHTIYSISKSNMFPVPNSTVLSNMAYSKNENRYKKLIRSMDLTKDFYFSYSYNIMLSLQKSLCNHEDALDLYDTMFVWNEFLTRGIRNQLKNTTWTVALIFGFFKQVQLLVFEKRFILTLIARRSRHYAGTRYLRRGVNEEGCVANDVETEQIVSEDGGEAHSAPISSVVQNRGSIPLFWSQETSLLSIKPDIRLSRKDQNYEATRLHFENLVQRYGNPVIIMNLVKTNEKKPRESILRSEFANAIEFLNKDLPESEHLKFLHWDLNKFSRNCSGVLDRIVDVASEALDLTGFFYCERAPIAELMHWSYLDKNWEWTRKEAEERVDERRPLMFQNGVLRTNCIDCLDRTNVAQYAYGLVALGRQLHALGLTDVSSVDIDSPLADKLMKIYEEMGDSLALQYGGSPAHKKIFAEKRGQWRAATRSQEFFRTLQRFYSNAYMDGEKQDSINVFLGHFQPMLSKPALWEAHSDRVGLAENSSLLENFIEHNCGFTPKSASGSSSSWVAKWFGSFMKRSLSDGNILSPVEESTAENNQESEQQSSRKRLLGSAPEISACESDIDCSRSTPSGSCRKLYPLSEPDLEHDHVIYSYERESFDYSNFLDFDWLSSSGNSVEDFYDRSTLISTLSADLASYASANQSSYASTSGLKGEERSVSHLLEDVGVQQSAPKYSEKFINWVDSELLFPV